MPLPQLPNVTFDVYRGFNTANPYNPPNRPAALRGVSGYLRNHVRNGKHGYYPAWAKEPLYWTNILEVNVGTDIRSKYNSQLNAWTESGGDTVMVPDYPYPGTCSAFLAVMVQRRDRGNALDRLRIYLDRARPSYGVVCIDPTSTGGTISSSCCVGTLLPATVYATFSGTASTDGTYALNYDVPTSSWKYTGAFGSCGSASITLLCASGPTRFEIIVGGIPHAFATSTSCSPLSVVFNNPGSGCGSNGAGTITVTS